MYILDIITNMNNKLLIQTLRNVTFVAVYVFFVSQIMQNGDRLFGEVDNMLAPFVFLLLFSLSAAVVGGLIFGQSIMLFLSGKKSESIKAAQYSVGWLGIYTVLGLILLLVLK